MHIIVIVIVCALYIALTKENESCVSSRRDVCIDESLHSGGVESDEPKERSVRGWLWPRELIRGVP
jgi:hypothetical protein